MTQEYKDTVFLPKTSFAMRGNLPHREPETLAKWAKSNLYQKMQQARQGAEKYVIHDGPPYANGHLHVGTALNKILKDICNRAHSLDGKQTPFVPGWDCHGLPIEWKVEEAYRAKGKSKEDVPLLQFRQECRAFAQKWLDIQREEFKRLGIMADWDHPYNTMSTEAEAGIVEELGKLLLDGTLVRGEKPVMWSVVEKTALAEAETEYYDKKSPSIYVAFPIVKTARPELQDASVIIWTTTPWTIPANRAVAYHKEVTYIVIESLQGGRKRKFILAQDLLQSVSAACKWEEVAVLHSLPGQTLEGSICRHPLHALGYTCEVPLLPGDHVTTEAGTGLVHTAPSHGIEDFQLGKQFNLEVPRLVQDDGYYAPHVPAFAGIHIFKAHESIIEALTAQAALIHHDEIVHSYPHSWRSKAPLIYRVTPQWFISMECTGLRQKALDALKKVQWFPEIAQRRIESMIANRPDWCISRQRSWGTPLTLFIHKKTGEVLRDAKVHARIVEAVRKEGGDAWYKHTPEDFLAPEYSSQDYEPVRDTLDVWFDSGTTHAFVLDARPELTSPAALYFEGSDQHRGWFHTSLLTACATKGIAPYQRVATHGFCLDEQGRKMSKSLGNVIAPEKIISEMGAEMLRLWIVNSYYFEDVRIGKTILRHQQDIYRRIRNTLRYLLGGLHEFDAAERLELSKMPDLEKWVYHRLYELDQARQTALISLNFQPFYAELHHFCATDLSAFYFDIRKDTLYCDRADAPTRRALRTAFLDLFHCLTTWLAPVLCFTAEEAWQAFHGEESSVHLQTFHPVETAWQNEALAQKMHGVRQARRLATTALEQVRTEGHIRSNLQAALIFYDPDSILPKDIDWAGYCIASQATIINMAMPKDMSALKVLQEDSLTVAITHAAGEKCQRCWQYQPDVGTSTAHPGLCQRCEEVITHHET